MELAPETRTLLSEARIMVLATVRPDGLPHAVPIWFVWHDDSLYFATGATSIKVRNLAHLPEAAAVVERGGEAGASHAILLQGPVDRVAARDMPPAVVSAFRGKYGWDLTSTGDGTALFALRPRHGRAW